MGQTLLFSLNDYNPDITLINVETTITTSNDYSCERSVHYRTHPQHIYTLKTLQQTNTHNNNLFCHIANNHMLDNQKDKLFIISDKLSIRL